jgi:hypothetical protein
MTGICARIQAQAAGLMSLAGDDPERRIAETHAVTCTACAAGLAEAGAVMGLLDRALPPAAPDSTRLARARQGILDRIALEAPRASMAAPRVERPRDVRRLDPRFLGVVVAVLAASWLVPMVAHIKRGEPAGVSALLAAAAIVAGVMSLWRGGAWLALPAVAALGFVAVGAGGGAPVLLLHGLECALFELALALAPLASVLAFARRGRADPTIVAGAAAGAAGAGALVAQAVLHVACPATASVAHSMIFHAAPVLLALSAAGLVGGHLGRRTQAR